MKFYKACIFTHLFFLPLLNITHKAYSETQASPNVVIILVDDLGWNDLSCTGSTYYETPNIDSLAAGGVRFTQAYAACAVCSPTRAALMTGRYPARLGITDWIRPPHQRKGKTPDTLPDPPPYISWDERPLLTPANVRNLPHEETTIAELLKGAGYTTCYVGKWHLGDDGFYPEDQGFDFNFGGCSFGQPPSYFDPYENNETGNIPNLPGRTAGEYLTDREGDEAANFIRNHKDKPFLLYYAPYAVHTPLQAKKELVEKYEAKSGLAQGQAAYAAMIESLDGAVGKIIDTLEEEGLRENTLIIFTSDNGGLLSSTDNRPLRSGKGFPWEGGIRVPAIINWQGKTQAGILDNTPFISTDIFPTVCAALGIEPPKDLELDGVSFWQLLTANKQVERDALYWHFPHYRYGEVTPYSIIREGDWKLILYYDGTPVELYNLDSDSEELKNLAEEMPEKTDALKQKLEAQLSGQGAKMPCVK